MNSVIEVFNVILSFLRQIYDGFLEFFNTIPLLFENTGNWANSLFPQEFVTYLMVFIPIMITLVIIKFVKG